MKDQAEEERSSGALGREEREEDKNDETGMGKGVNGRGGEGGGEGVVGGGGGESRSGGGEGEDQISVFLQRLGVHVGYVKTLLSKVKEMGMDTPEDIRYPTYCLLFFFFKVHAFCMSFKQALTCRAAGFLMTTLWHHSLFPYADVC